MDLDNAHTNILTVTCTDEARARLKKIGKNIKELEHTLVVPVKKLTQKPT